eukprot:Gb_06917 [translate_table: standard]
MDSIEMRIKELNRFAFDVEHPKVDIPSTEENPPLIESIHEVDNGCVLTKDNDEVVEDDDKVAGEDPSTSSSKAHEVDNICILINIVAGDDYDEAAGETTSTSSSRNKCESFMNS